MLLWGSIFPKKTKICVVHAVVIFKFVRGAPVQKGLAEMRMESQPLSTMKNLLVVLEKHVVTDVSKLPGIKMTMLAKL